MLRFVRGAAVHYLSELRRTSWLRWVTRQQYAGDPYMPAFDRRQLLTALGGLALSPLAASAAPDGDEWPQFRGPNRDGVWREKGIIAKFAAPTLTPKWAAPIGNGYSGPT